MKYSALIIFSYLALEMTYKLVMGDQYSQVEFSSSIEKIPYSDDSDEEPFLIELQHYCSDHFSLSVPVPGKIITVNHVDIDVCSTTIHVRDVTRIELDFIKFNIDFRLDYFAILHGGNGDILRKYYGNKLPPSFVTASNTLTVEFQKISQYNSEKYVELHFFSSNKSASELDIINTEYCEFNGNQIESHNLTNANYSNNMEKVWHVNNIAEHVIYFIGYNFSTEEHYDQLWVGKGKYPDNKMSTFYHISGQHDFVLFSTNFPEIWLLFKTDETINSNGFSLKANFKKREHEQYYLNQTKGVITSPNFPHYYLPNHRITWYIELPINQIIQIIVHTLDLDVEANDYVVIGYGHLSMKGDFFPLTGKMTETSRNFVSYSNKAYVYFISNASIKPRVGFNITWRPVTEHLGPYPPTTPSPSSTEMTSQGPSYEQMMNAILIRLDVAANASDEKFMACFRKNMAEFVTDFCIETEDYCLSVEIVHAESIVIVNVTKEDILVQNSGFLLKFFVKSEEPEEVVMSRNQLEEMVLFYSSINFFPTRFGYNITIDQIDALQQNWLIPSLVILSVSLIISSVIYCYVELCSHRCKRIKTETSPYDTEQPSMKFRFENKKKINPIYDRKDFKNFQNDDENDLLDETDEYKKINETKLQKCNSIENNNMEADLNDKFLHYKNSIDINSVNDQNICMETFVPPDFVLKDELPNFTNQTILGNTLKKHYRTNAENKQRLKIEDSNFIDIDMRSFKTKLLPSVQPNDQGHSNPAYVEDPDSSDFYF